jgi:hypothetical protein
MNKTQWLLLGTCALSFYGVGQVWLVQLSSYRLWANRILLLSFASRCRNRNQPLSSEYLTP